MLCLQRNFGEKGFGGVTSLSIHSLVSMWRHRLCTMSPPKRMDMHGSAKEPIVSSVDWPLVKTVDTHNISSYQGYVYDPRSYNKRGTSERHVLLECRRSDETRLSSFSLCVKLALV